MAPFKHFKLITAFWVSMSMAFQCASPALCGNIGRTRVITAPAPMYLPDVPVPVYVWSKADVSPKAIILGLHGGAMHGRSFNVLGKRLAARNYCLVSLDMRGYGKPFHEKTPGVRRFNYKKTVSDIHKIIAHIKNDYPDTPIICLGESMGANVALFIGGDSPELIDGIIAISPFASPRFFMYPQMGAHLVQFLLNPCGRLDMSVYLKRRLALDWQRSRQHLKDPLTRNRLSVPEVIQTCIFNLAGKRNSRVIPAYMPVLFLVGKYDRLCSFKGTERMFERIPSMDKKLVVVQDHGHLMIEADIIRPSVLTNLFQWLDTHKDRQVQVAQNPQKPGNVTR